MDRIELPDVVDLDNVRVHQRCDSPRFLEETLLMVLRADVIGSHHFERDVSVQRLLKRQIYLRHPTDPQPMQDRIAGNGLVGQFWG